jgi:hypothetical protein
MKPPTKHNTLNDKQLYILKLAYKFRFITAPLLAEYKDLKSRHSMYMTLELLAKQGYLLRRKDNTPFSNKGIRYGLAPKGFTYLKEAGVSSEALKPLYRNKDVLEDFVDHSVTAMRVFLALKDPALGIYGRTELHDFEDFPQTRPDLFIRRKKPSKTKPNLYFVELWHDQPLFIAKKRLKNLINHYDSEWPEETYPTLLFVLVDERAEKSFKKFADNLLEDSGMEDEIDVEATNLDKFSRI